MRCRAVLLKSTVLLRRSRLTDGNDPYVSKFLGEAFRVRRNTGIGNMSWKGTQAGHGLFGRGSRMQAHRERQAECEKSEGSVAAGRLIV